MTIDGSASILIIDGNHQEREYYAHGLKLSSPDYEVFQAADGKTGLARSRARLFDCVVLELDLPDISGFEVLLKLVPRPRCPEFPVIVLTRLANQALLGIAVVNGAQACLQKNETSSELLSRVILKAMAAVGGMDKEKRRSDQPDVGLDVEMDPHGLSMGSGSS
ncbi:MAG: response regulator [Nitrospira sp.]|nr:response regulator [Nitrospira sp.]